MHFFRHPYANEFEEIQTRLQIDESHCSEEYFFKWYIIHINFVHRITHSLFLALSPRHRSHYYLYEFIERTCFWNECSTKNALQIELHLHYPKIYFT